MTHDAASPPAFSPSAERLVETLTELADLSVDRSSRVVHNLALTGRDSRNGYRYSESALRAALPLYDHKPVFLDHAADRSRPHDRSTRDLVGAVVNPRFDDGRIRADVRVLDTDSGRTFLALAGADTPGVGMSHVVLARRSPDGALVEHIQDVISVDAVVNPATTQTFRESADGPLSQDASPSEISNLKSQITSLTAERDQLRAALHSLEHQREQDVRDQRMDALLSESRLPAWAVTDRFRQALRAAPDDAARGDLIRERLDLLTRAARHPPNSADRTAATPSPDAPFIAAIKRRQ